jgi:hypothetical protein
METASYILLVLTVILLMIFMWFVVRKKKGSMLDRYTGKLEVIGSLFIPLGIFLTYRVFTLQHESMGRDTTYKLIDRGWLDVNKNMVKFYKDCPKFINSLYFDWQRKVMGPTEAPQGEDKWYAVNYMSILIFQAWEDWLTSAQVDQTEHEVWINNFLTWANSDILRENWAVLKSNYSPTTQRVGDYFFFTASSFHPKNDAELHHVAETVARGEAFKQILKLRSEHV